MIKLSFHPSAIVDISLSQDWYAQESDFAANKFSSSLMKTIKILEEFPQSFPIDFLNIRKAVVHGFPYNIYYQFEKHEIIILAIANTHREPTHINKTIKHRKH